MKISTCICEIVFSVEVLPPVKGSDIDVTPVQKFLSREYLGDLRWQAGDGGAIYEGKDRLTPVGFVPALEKLIALAMGQGGSKSVECLRLRTDLSPNAAVEDPEIPSDNLLNLVSCAGGRSRLKGGAPSMTRKTPRTKQCYSVRIEYAGRRIDASPLAPSDLLSGWHRDFEISDKTTLEQLSSTILQILAWNRDHLYEFRIGDRVPSKNSI